LEDRQAPVADTAEYIEGARQILENGLSGCPTREIELGLLRRFQRQYFHFAKSVTPDESATAAANPRRLNERLVLQQGVFLCPGDVTRPFADNLAAVLSQTPSEAKAHFRKVLIANNLDFRKELLHRLLDMNLSRATLFPGLDGFAASLIMRLVSPKRLLHYPPVTPTADP
jgi:hypothetical protein